MKIRLERWMWRFYLDISIDLMVMARVDAHSLGLFKGFNERSDGDSTHFDFFCSFPSCCWLKMRVENSHCDLQLFSALHMVYRSYLLTVNLIFTLLLSSTPSYPTASLKNPF